jgi:hypothetical protein
MLACAGAQTRPYRSAQALAMLPMPSTAAAPSSRAFVTLLEAFRASGGAAPAGIVGRLLDEHQAGTAVSLAKLVSAGEVSGFEWRSSLWIPMFLRERPTSARGPSPGRLGAPLT